MRALIVLPFALLLLVAAPQATASPFPAAAEGPGADLLLDPHPGARLPLDAQLTDAAGQTIALGKFFTGKPVLLAFQYLRCKTICGIALGHLAEAVPGLDATVLAISIDPRDTPADAAKAKARYAETGPAGNWHFLTGPESAVRPIADAAGFRYRYDSATGQYIHSVGYVVVAADGTISSYLPELGVTSAQLRDALAAAAARQPSTPFERFLLLCFGGAPHGRFTGLIETALVLFNLAGVLGAIGVFAWTRRHRHG
jgi:protein SCO1